MPQAMGPVAHRDKGHMLLHLWSVWHVMKDSVDMNLTVEIVMGILDIPQNGMILPPVVTHIPHFNKKKMVFP